MSPVLQLLDSQSAILTKSMEKQQTMPLPDCVTILTESREKQQTMLLPGDGSDFDRV